MERHNVLMSVVLVVLLCGVSCSFGESSLHMVAYPTLSTSEILESLDYSTTWYNKLIEGVNCQFSTTKGRRQYQEDRISCNLGFNKFTSERGFKPVKVGVVAVFDGHIGEEASDMASKLFLSRFFENTLIDNYLFQPDFGYVPVWSGPKGGNDKSTLGSIEEYVRMEHPGYMVNLKNALIKTIKDIDVEITKEAVKHKFASGTTAVIVLLVDGHILVANVGDSKALLCSENAAQPSQEGGSPQLYAEELTRDHTALIDEERARIEAAGGYILDWKVPLVMGHFPMTRAIGDLPLKRYGVIAEPEVTEWRPLSEKDKYLVVASDGIFETLSPKHVCNILQSEGNETSTNHTTDSIVKIAYEKGSSDNLSVVVVPLPLR